MNTYIKCGPLVIQLRDFLQYNLWCHWQWKLDPFFIHKNDNVVQLILEKSHQHVDKNKLLYQEQSGFFEKQFYSSHNGIIWEITRRSNHDVIIRYNISLDWKCISLLEDHSQSYGFTAFESIGQLFCYSAIQYSILSFHGVLMEYQGKGIIISAASGTGKTTHARLWRDYKNALIINGDRSCCYKQENQWIGFGIPWSGTSGENINRNVPIHAIVILERGTSNHAEKLDKYTGFQYLFPHLLYPCWDISLTNKTFDLLDDFIHSVDIIRLSCLPNKESVETLLEAINYV